MKTIKIDTEAYMYENDYKGYVYCEDLFDETFVITGNPNYKGVASASWYCKAVEYLEELDEEVNPYSIIHVLEILFPDDEFEYTQITGYVQGEWQDVIYKKSEIENFDSQWLADFYFGYVAEIYDEEEDIGTYVSKSELWNVRDHGDLKQYIRDLLQIDDEEDFQVLKSNGYIMVQNWELCM